MTFKNILKMSALAGVLAMAAAQNASAATDAKTFAAERLSAFSKGNIAELVAQYTEDATVITSQGVLHGHRQIQPMIEGIIAEFSNPGVTFNMVSQNAEGDVVTFVWSAVTASHVYDLAVETYVLKDGKAQYQTFAAKMAAK